MDVSPGGGLGAAIPRSSPTYAGLLDAVSLPAPTLSLRVNLVGVDDGKATETVFTRGMS